ncbi:MAG TPA: ribokinase [Intrasporangium sp.]|uniref:ribokinase n=1 Tax=Intrasporangium sp. TaxID=1925024 RepID=UPI002D788932|nr:ribokinase [Intrasporangium sp.]HET7398919.1 ribokinase [Intrasporangium sp.]
MARVVVLGSLNVDVVTRVERHPRPGETVLGEPAGRFAGGKGANQAVAARRAGADVTMLGAVGRDDAGTAYLARLRALGITCMVPQLDAHPTGTALITVDEAGENTIVVVPGANAALSRPQLVLAPGDVLLASLEVPVGIVAEAARRAHAAGARVVLNLAPYAAVPPDVVALADPLVVNESEAALLADSDLLPSSLLVTFGAAGAVWDGERVDGVAVPADRLVDSVGAGDAFCGALAAALAAGADRTEALAVAARAGADAVAWPGAQPHAAL